MVSISLTTGNDNYDGTGSADTIHGREGSDSIDGLAGSDTIYGDEGNDTLHGSGGHDKLYGGSGVDKLYGGDGNDYLEANESTPGSGERDKLYGEDGNDTLRPGGGGYADMYGGAGDDDIVGTIFSYVEGGAGADKLVGAGGQVGAILGYRGSPSAVSIDLGKNTASGGDAQGDTIRKFNNVEGSNFNDVLRGNKGANGLTGGKGNDRLFGLGGDDALTGGDGRDKLYGAKGDDTLRGGAGADLLDGGKGEDKVSYSNAKSGVTASLVSQGKNKGEAAGDKYKSIEHLEGSGFNDKLFGDKRANKITDLGGADVIRAGGGDDTINASDKSNAARNDKIYGEGGDDLIYMDIGADYLNGGKGTDTLSIASFSLNTIQKLFLNGKAAIGGNAAGAKIVNFEIVRASYAGDIDIIGGKKGEDISTGSGENTLIGNGGNDILDGGSGDDILKGGNGNDLLIGDAGADVLNGGKGHDIASYRSAFGDLTIDLAKGRGQGDDAEGDKLSKIEEVQAGFGDDTLIGNGAKNLLDGYYGNDLIKGGGGNDRLIGDGGDDMLIGGSGRNIFEFGKYDGSDTIKDFKNGKDKLDLTAFGFDKKSQALAEFTDAGGKNNNKVMFDDSGTDILVLGIDLKQLDGSDILI